MQLSAAIPLLGLVTLTPIPAEALKLATWNIEHLAEKDGEGCRPRTTQDYETLKKYAEKLRAGVVAVQGVENDAALARVFDPKTWSIEIAKRPPETTPRPCGGSSTNNARAQQTGQA
jgi:hypothetical protein